jgi:ADP-heptose:LPS heptosyltransferase
MHIAAAVRTPVISLWGATRPQRTRPTVFPTLSFKERRPAFLVIAGVVWVCLRSINAEQIGETISNVLCQRTSLSMTHARRE